MLAVRNGTTYYLKGGDNGASYSTNVGTLTTAFGSGNCEDDDNSSIFSCDVSSLHTYTYDDDQVSAGGDDWNCYVYDSGRSRCDNSAGTI